MKLSTLLFTATFFASTFANPIAKRDVPTVREGLSTLAVEVQILDDSITNFVHADGPEGTVRIHEESLAIISTVGQIASSIQAAAAFSETDARAVLDDVLAIEPTLTHALVMFPEKGWIFSAIPADGVLKRIGDDLREMNTAYLGFFEALVAKTPESLNMETRTAGVRLNFAFIQAISMYTFPE